MEKSNNSLTRDTHTKIGKTDKTTYNLTQQTLLTNLRYPQYFRYFI